MVEKRTELVVDVDQQIYARGPLLWRGEYGTLSCLQKCVYGGEGELKRERERFRQRSDVLAVADDNWAAEVWKKLVQNKQRYVCCVVLCRVVLCRVVSCRVVSCRVVLCRVVSCCVVLCRVVLCRVVSCRVVSSTKNTSHRETSRGMWCKLATGTIGHEAFYAHGEKKTLSKQETRQYHVLGFECSSQHCSSSAASLS